MTNAQPLLCPVASRRTVHSSMLPNEENMRRTSFSVHFLESIPMKSFLSFLFSLSAGFICIGWCISNASQGSGNGNWAEVLIARPLPLSKDLASRPWKSCLLRTARLTAAFAFSRLLSRLLRCRTSIEARVIGPVGWGPPRARLATVSWCWAPATQV